LYFSNLQKWLKLFPRDQFFIESTENMSSNPQKTYSSVLNFLGVDDFIINDFKIFRENEYKIMKKQTRNLLEEFYKPYNEDLYRFLNYDLNW